MTEDAKHDLLFSITAILFLILATGGESKNTSVETDVIPIL
jgi:hypothetical protein